MSGTIEGGKRAAATNKKKYGEDFYKNMGRKGGSAWTNKLKGFAANPELAKIVGARAGHKTKRGFKWLGDADETHGRYKNRATGEEVVLKYGKAE